MLEKQKGITAGTAALIIAVVAAAMGGGLYLATQLPSSAPDSSDNYVNVSSTQRNVKLGSSLADLDLTGSTPEKTSNLVDGANKFAFELYSAGGGKQERLHLPVQHPHGPCNDLRRGQWRDAEEMETALNLPPEDDVRLPAFAELHEKLNSDRAVKLKTANALWPQENSPSTRTTWRRSRNTTSPGLNPSTTLRTLTSRSKE